MTIKANQVTLLAATPTKVASGVTGSDTGPVSVIIWNNSGANIFLGGPTVNTTNGLPVANNAFSPAFDLVGDDLWVYSTAGGTIQPLVTRQ